MDYLFGQVEIKERLRVCVCIKGFLQPFGHGESWCVNEMILLYTNSHKLGTIPMDPSFLLVGNQPLSVFFRSR